ncbi:hypothetical protein ACEV7Z_23300, partial [Vibrio parahaemolyticus]
IAAETKSFPLFSKVCMASVVGTAIQNNTIIHFVNLAMMRPLFVLNGKTNILLGKARLKKKN